MGIIARLRNLVLDHFSSLILDSQGFRPVVSVRISVFVSARTVVSDISYDPAVVTNLIGDPHV